MLLEEYVSSLKSMVGMNILVEAVGIGKGKQDLTSLALDPSKSNQVLNIPIGKACSSLTPNEIIKFLTGDYRLSKARSNDLFWEAVWPLLLAQGWHSEEPSNRCYYAAGSKHSLVFLAPGVKKFSRRGLVKGTQYFDSVTDVLSKVALEPELLEVDIEKNEGNEMKEEYEWSNETKPEQDDLHEPPRHCYLQPRTPCRGADAMKFTVVDTSLALGKTCKVRELRTLPLEISKTSSHGDSDRVSVDESDCANTALIDQEETSKIKHAMTMNGTDSTDATLNNLKNQKSGRPKQNHLDCPSPPAKRHRKLSVCGNSVTPSFFSDAIELSQACSSDDKFSSTSSSRGSPIETIENLNQKPRPKLLFDLNVLPDDESGEFVKEFTREPEPFKASVTVDSSEPQPNGNYRRQSTRNRPPTARALEALANGFLTINRRQKVKEGGARENHRSRTSKRSRGVIEFITENASELKESANGGNSGAFDEFSVLSEANGTRVSGL